MSEQLLWRSVITQAILDATAPMSTRIGKRKPIPGHLSPDEVFRLRAERDAARLDRIDEVKREQSRAREWLLRGGADFAKVCDYAGLDPAAVRDRAIDLAHKGWPSEYGSSVAEAA